MKGKNKTEGAKISSHFFVPIYMKKCNTARMFGGANFKRKFSGNCRYKNAPLKR